MHETALWEFRKQFLIIVGTTQDDKANQSEKTQINCRCDLNSVGLPTRTLTSGSLQSSVSHEQPASDDGGQGENNETAALLTQ